MIETCAADFLLVPPCPLEKAQVEILRALDAACAKRGLGRMNEPPTVVELDAVDGLRRFYVKARYAWVN